MEEEGGKDRLHLKQDKNQGILAYSSGVSAKQEQIHNIVFSKEIGWQEIIHDLINSEQLDPWDIDISVLTKKYLEKIERFEEQNYFISSKVLLAAALLLRIKSEVLLSKYMKGIDEIVFGKKEQPLKKDFEMIDFNLEDDLPELFPKSPMPRMRKVTLKELVDSLNRAIITENRRIKKEFVRKDFMKELSIAIPRRRYIISDTINEVWDKINDYFARNPQDKKIPFGRISGITKDGKIITFISLLHLESQEKIWIEQEIYFGEMYIWKKGDYLKEHDPLAELKEEQEIEEIVDS